MGCLMCSMGGGCATTCLLMVVGWLLIASGLLYITWNHVLSDLFKVKKAKFWYAIAVISTVAVLCLPGKLMGRRGGCGFSGCPSSHMKCGKNCPLKNPQAAPTEAQTQ